MDITVKDGILNELTTQDIYLAVFLDLKGIKPAKIENIDYWNCKLSFKDVPQILLTEWLLGDAQASIRRSINSYRHMVRECRANYTPAVDSTPKAEARS